MLIAKAIWPAAALGEITSPTTPGGFTNFSSATPMLAKPFLAKPGHPAMDDEGVAANLCEVLQRLVRREDGHIGQLLAQGRLRDSKT